jgi:hypothetical protein
VSKKKKKKNKKKKEIAANAKLIGAPNHCGWLRCTDSTPQRRKNFESEHRAPKNFKYANKRKSSRNAMKWPLSISYNMPEGPNGIPERKTIFRKKGKVAQVPNAKKLAIIFPPRTSFTCSERQ